jgi:hypothetical protein
LFVPNPPPKSTQPAPEASRLRELQRQFASGIMRPLTPEQTLHPEWHDGRPSSEVVAGFIKPNDRLTSVERLEIYNRQYWYRLIDCFYEDFPGLRTLLGDRVFSAMTEAYLHRHRSRSFTLRDLGQDLEKFLGEEPQWTEKQPVLARDLVRLEWAQIVAFDSEALPPLEIDDLLGQDPATLHLSLQPHLTLLACSFPVDTFLIATRRRDEPQGGASHAVSERTRRKGTKKVPRPREKATWLAVHRHGHSVYYKRLDPAAFALLAALRAGKTLNQACEEAAPLAAGDFATELKDWFTQWATFGWFCAESAPRGD